MTVDVCSVLCVISGRIHFCKWHVSCSIHLGRCVVLCFEHWIVVTNRLFLLQVSHYSHWYVVIFVPANIGYPKKQMVITLSRHWPVNLFHPGVLTILTYNPVRIPVSKSFDAVACSNLSHCLLVVSPKQMGSTRFQMNSQLGDTWDKFSICGQNRWTMYIIPYIWA